MTPSPSRSRAGFSILELLVVVGIMAIFGAITAPTLSYVAASRFNKAAGRVADLLEEARQYAVANNTYTWVAFHIEPSANGKPAALYVAALASMDGTSEAATGSSFGSATAWPAGVTAPLSNCQLIGRVESFPQTGLAEKGAYPLPGLPAVSALDGPATTAPAFSLSVPTLGTQTFTRAIQFTPSGEAKVQAAPVPAIEFGLCAMNGTSASQSQVAVMRVNGYTGQARVYLP